MKPGQENKLLPTSLKTKRLILRPFKESDIQDIMEYAAQEAWYKYLPVPVPYTIEDAKQFISLVQNQDETSQALAIVNKEDNKVIGGFNVKLDIDENQIMIGYSISPNYHKLGLGSEVGLFMIDQVFNNTNCNKIWADVDVRNIGSNILLKKLGLTKVKTVLQDRKVRDEIVDVSFYELERADWEKSKKVK